MGGGGCPLPGVKIIRAHVPETLKKGGRALGIPELEARPTPRNFRHENGERKDIFHISN